MQKLIYPEMHELFQDPFAHHAYQAILSTLIGHPERNVFGASDKRKRIRQSEESSAVTIPLSFERLHEKLLATLKAYDWSVLESLVFDKYAAPLLQSILETDTLKKIKGKHKGKKKEKVETTLVDILLTGAGDSAGMSLIS
jgi:hypothetical protein